GGTGGIADTCKLYRTLDIPVAVVADLDLIANPDALQRVIEAKGDRRTSAATLKKAKAAVDQIRRLPPKVDPAECTQRLSEIAAMRMNWQRGDDTKVRGKLNALTQELDRMRR